MPPWTTAGTSVARDVERRRGVGGDATPPRQGESILLVRVRTVVGVVCTEREPPLASAAASQDNGEA